MNRNFALLESRWPQLTNFAQHAEQYVYTDPQSALTKLRCFCESLVGILYRELNLPCEPRANLLDKLKSQMFVDVVGEEVCQKLHAIRMKGNRAVHHNEATTDDALWLLKEAYFIGQWLYKTYSDEQSVEHPAFVIPEKPNSIDKLAQSHDELTIQLEAAKQELISLENSEKNAQIELSNLKKKVDDLKLSSFKEKATLAANSIDFEQEITRDNISIEDIFSEYDLTSGQSELVQRLDSFLNGKGNNIFQLKGYAGTGKTFITKGLTEYLRAVGRRFVLAAPTGKAAKVISNKTNCEAYTLHKTIYSFKDLVEYSDEKNLDSETYKVYAEIAVNELSADTVFIVDESSMISDFYQESEFFRCGSGKLLSDFLKFVNLDHNDHRKKVIFIGDDAQLPPVGMSSSPALSSYYLNSQFGLKADSFELTEVVRQKANSGVMQTSIALRKALNSGVFNQLTIETDIADIEEVEYAELMSKYLQSCHNKINAESIIIAGSNKDVLQYNQRIREHFFPQQSEICAGDKIMAVSNSDRYGFFISNGEFGLVRQVLGPSETRKIILNPKSKDKRIEINLTFRDVEVGFKDLDGHSHFFKAKIAETLLYSEQPQLSSDQNKALYVDFCMRYSYLPRKSLEFKETLYSDPYFNALRVKFGYAITCHKAQGSEWNHVFVKCKTHENILSSGYFRWLYTAITRTASKLYLLEAPKIKLGSNLKSTSYIGQSMIKPAPDYSGFDNATLEPINEVDEHTIDEPIETGVQESHTFDIPSTETFLLQLLAAVRDHLKQTDIVIEGIGHNQWQESYTFNRKGNIERLDIWYNAKGKVSQISSPSMSPLSSELVNLLSPLKVGLMLNSESREAVSFSQDFQVAFHSRLMDYINNTEITLLSAEEQQWALRYSFSKGSSLAVIDINFNGKQQFTKIQTLRNKCIGADFVLEVENILTQGLSA
jgi:tRNA A37 threonylcarbamoyladenosine biosynthesis protein TsaE